MSIFNWRNGFAVGLTAGISLTLFLGIAFSQISKNATTGNDLADQLHEREDGRWWLIDGVVFAEDTAAQWLMTILTAVAAYLLLETLWATQRMARETTRIGEAQVRAYPSIVGARVKYKATREGIEWSLGIEVQNTGQSPARQLHVVVPDWPRGSMGQSMMIGDFGAGESGTVWFPLFTPEDEVEFTPGRDDEVPFGAGIQLKWEDVFGVVHDDVSAYYVGFPRIAEEGEIPLRRSNVHNLSPLNIDVETGNVTHQRRDSA